MINMKAMQMYARRGMNPQRIPTARKQPHPEHAFTPGRK